MKYQYNMQEIIKTLKHDLPTLFQQDISYDIYSQDIYFRDPVNKFKGKINYRIIFWTLRFHGRFGVFCVFPGKRVYFLMAVLLTNLTQIISYMSISIPGIASLVRF